MLDVENSSSVGDWTIIVRRDESELQLTAYLIEPIWPRVSFLVRKQELTLLQMYDERWVDMPDGPFPVRASIDDRPVVKLSGYGFMPQAVVVAANFWPDFLDQIRDASTLRLQVGSLVSEMPLAGAHTVLVEALRKARTLMSQFRIPSNA
jgi:hypothetical protein